MTATKTGASAETVGARVKRLRLEAGLSQRQLAIPEKRITYSYLSRVENEERTPSLRAIRILAPRLGVSPVLLETGLLETCPHCGGKPPA